ncbi:MAG TPA: hypothetical protein VFQ61_07545 [Polyangiaceae bacterium]|nr:hypothetical protein [Polyangiaceae bacterium]
MASRESLWTAVLDRQRARRVQGVPTLTVLLGDPERSELVWSRWKAISGGRVCTSTRADAHALLEDWLSEAETWSAARFHFSARAALRLAHTPQELRAQLRLCGAEQIWQLAEELVGIFAYPKRLISALLQTRGTPSELASIANDSFPGALTALAEVLGAELPALMMRAPTEAAQLSTGLPCLLAFAEAAPSADLAVATTRPLFERWCAAAPAPVRTRACAGAVQVTPDRRGDALLQRLGCSVTRVTAVERRTRSERVRTPTEPSIEHRRKESP